MKICHLVPNLYAGGAQTFIILLAIEQKKLGHDVFIILIDNYNHSDFEVYLFNQIKQYNIQIFSLQRKPGRNFTIFKSFMLLNRIIKNTNPEIINSHLQFTHLIAAIYFKVLKFNTLKMKLILTIHNAPEVWNFQTLLLNLKTPSIYCSQASLSYSKARDCKRTVIENGIRLPLINNSADAILEKYKNNTKHKLILMVGKLSRQKNYALAVDIASKLQDKNISFLICGILEDTSTEDLALFKTLNNIHYLGIKVPDEIYSLMYKCDCFLNTSIFEGLPITVLEAFFIGVPCVLSPILPHKEIGLAMPACYLPESLSAQLFVDSINEALNNTHDKEQIKQSREKLLAKYQIANTAKKYIAFYQSVLKTG